MATDQDSDGEGEDYDHHVFLRLTIRGLFLVHYVGRIRYLWAGLKNGWIPCIRPLQKVMQGEASEVRIEGLETPDYLDSVSDRKRFTEQGDATTFESECVNSWNNQKGDKKLAACLLPLKCMATFQQKNITEAKALNQLESSRTSSEMEEVADLLVRLSKQFRNNVECAAQYRKNVDCAAETGPPGKPKRWISMRDLMGMKVFVHGTSCAMDPLPLGGRLISWIRSSFNIQGNGPVEKGMQLCK